MSGRPRRDCMLAPFVDGYRQRLELVGYTPGTVCNQLAVVGRLGRWMALRGVAVDQLGCAEIDAFVAACRRDGARQVVFRPGLLLLRQHLISVGATPVDAPVGRSDLDDLIGSYRGGCCVIVGWPRRPCAVTRAPRAGSSLSAPAVSMSVT
jgi:hypothetical protein